MPIERPGKYGGTLRSQQKGDKALPNAGHPKGQKNLKTLIAEIDKAITSGKKKDLNDINSLTTAEVAIVQMLRILKSSKSDFAKLAAAQELLDRIYGKTKPTDVQPVQQVENQQINIYLDGKKIDLSK